jgi:hypothetical protein
MADTYTDTPTLTGLDSPGTPTPLPTADELARAINPTAPAQRQPVPYDELGGRLGQGVNEYLHVVPEQIVRDMEGRRNHPVSLAQAAFETHNMIGSALASEPLRERLFPTDQTPISTDELIEHLGRDQLWGLDNFLNVHTVGEYRAVRAQLEREIENRQALADASVFMSAPLAILAGTFDLPTLIPAHRLVRGIQLGSPVLSVGAQTSAAALLSTGLQEAGLHASQNMRTSEETLYALGGAGVLGFVLGSGAASIARGDLGRIAQRTRQVWQDWLREGPDWNQRVVTQAREALDAVNDEIAARVASGKPITPMTKTLAVRQKAAFDTLKAAEDRLKLLDDTRMAPVAFPFNVLEWARTAVPRVMGQFNARWLDPIDYVFKRQSSAVAREAVEQMIEIPVLQNRNLRGEATPLAATTEADTWLGGWATFRDRMLGGSLRDEAKRTVDLGDSYFAQARRAGFTGNWRDFDAAVDRALRNGGVDPHGNPAVTKAAKDAKALIINPVRDEARAAGIDLPDQPFGAAGYAPRRYRVMEVRGPDGKGTLFRRTVADWEYQRLEAEAQAALAAGQQLSPQKLVGMRRRARNFADEAFQSVVRGRIDEESGFSNAFLSGGSPMRSRVVPVPDSVLLANNWIETSITATLNVYLRQTVPTIMLAKRFKTAKGVPDPSMEHSVIPAVVREYDQLASVAKSSEEAEQITREGATTVQMVRNLRDALLHTDRSTAYTREHSKLSSLVQYTKLYNVLRLMGNMPLSQLPDVGNIVLRQGPGRLAMNVADSFRRVVRLEGVNGQAVADEAKRLGAAIEWSSNASVAAMAELHSPLDGISTATTRTVHNITRAYSIANLSVHWNDMMKRATYRTSVDRVLEASERGWTNLPDSERIFLSHLGLDESKIDSIGAAWRAQPETHDGFLRWATVTDWSDQEAARAMAGALNKDVASTIIRPRTGDRALGFSGPIASLVLQFQSFMMSHSLRTLTLSGQRLAANGYLSADALNVYTGFGVTIGLGMLAHYLYAVARDAVLPERERRHVRQLEENTGEWLARGIDRSGVLGILGNVNGIWERSGGVGTTRAFQTLAGDPPRLAPASGRSLWERDALVALLGPTASEFSDVARFGVNWGRHLADGRRYTRQDAATLRQALPFQNLMWLRGFFDSAERMIGQDLLGVPYPAR